MSQADNTHYLGFKVDETLVAKMNTFIHAVEAGERSAGESYVAFVEDLTRQITGSLLVEMVEIADIGKMGQKVVNVCVSSSNKVSGMLTAKIYKKRPVKELGPVAELWKSRLHQREGGQWYLVAPIDDEFGAALDAIRQEKGNDEHFAPSHLDGVMSQYDRLSKAIIDLYFLEATRLVEMGGITKKMLSTGVSTVEKAVESVFDKAIRPLEPKSFGRFVDHIHQFHVRA